MNRGPEVARVRIPAARNYELVQKSDKVDAPGFVDFVSVLAYRFCPNLPPAFTQPKALILANLYDRILSIICKPRSRLACQKIFCIKQRFLPVRTVHPVFFYFTKRGAISPNYHVCARVHSQRCEKSGDFFVRSLPCSWHNLFSKNELKWRGHIHFAKHRDTMSKMGRNTFLRLFARPKSTVQGVVWAKVSLEVMALLF